MADFAVASPIIVDAPAAHIQVEPDVIVGEADLHVDAAAEIDPSLEAADQPIHGGPIVPQDVPISPTAAGLPGGPNVDPALGGTPPVYAPPRPLPLPGQPTGPAPGAGPAAAPDAVFTCPHATCAKTYTGKHARSIWRRHLQDKHGVSLADQPRRTRWDDHIPNIKNPPVMCDHPGCGKIYRSTNARSMMRKHAALAHGTAAEAGAVKRSRPGGSTKKTGEGVEKKPKVKAKPKKKKNDDDEDDEDDLGEDDDEAEGGRKPKRAKKADDGSAEAEDVPVRAPSNRPRRSAAEKIPSFKEILSDESDEEDYIFRPKGSTSGAADTSGDLPVGDAPPQLNDANAQAGGSGLDLPLNPLQPQIAPELQALSAWPGTSSGGVSKDSVGAWDLGAAASAAAAEEAAKDLAVQALAGASGSGSAGLPDFQQAMTLHQQQQLQSQADTERARLELISLLTQQANNGSL